MDRIPHIGQILKNTREDLDLTQLKVMELTGINHKTLSGYENGVAEPDLQALVTLCRLYRISMDAAMGLRPAPDALVLTRQEKELISLYRSLSPEGRKDLNRFLLRVTPKDDE
jgi:transcriptional regulator with XRE-family HTH domain